MSKENKKSDDVEGRHLSDTDSAEKIDKSQKRYRGTELGKQAVKRDNESERAKDSRKKYHGTPKGKLTVAKFQQSERGKSGYMKRQGLKDIAKDCSSFLKDHPGTTVMDYLAGFEELERLLNDDTNS